MSHSSHLARKLPVSHHAPNDWMGDALSQALYSNHLLSHRLCCCTSYFVWYTCNIYLPFLSLINCICAIRPKVYRWYEWVWLLLKKVLISQVWIIHHWLFKAKQNTMKRQMHPPENEWFVFQTRHKDHSCRAACHVSPWWGEPSTYFPVDVMADEEDCIKLLRLSVQH